MDIIYMISVTNSDGTPYCTDNNTGADVRLRNSTSAGADSGEYTGNTASSGAFTEEGTATGLWSIYIDDGDSEDWLLAQRYDAGWAAIKGLNPFKADISPNLKTSGGTMTGDIVMGDNQITGVDNITFTDTAGAIAGIANSNLLDKSAGETISGSWRIADLDATALKINGTSLTASASNLDKAAADVDNRSTETIVSNADYTVTDDDTGAIRVTATTTNVTITLPPLGSGNYGKIYSIILENVSGGKTLTVRRDPVTSDSISDPVAGTGNTSLTVTNQWDAVVVLSIGYHFWILLGT